MLQSFYLIENDGDEHQERRSSPRRTTMLQLVPMTETEFRAFRAADIAQYAQGHVQAGRWRSEESLRLVEQEFNDLLPDGLATQDHYFFSLRDEALGAPVGSLWFAV